MPMRRPRGTAIRPILTGHKSLIVGIANDHSIAYGCAEAFREAGADLAVTWLNDKARPHVEPLGEALGAEIMAPLNVENPGELEALFDEIRHAGASSTASSTRSPSRRRKTCRAGCSIARPRASRGRWTSPATRSCAWRS